MQISMQVIAVNGFFNGEKYVLNGELTLSNIKVCIFFTLHYYYMYIFPNAE